VLGCVLVGRVVAAERLPTLLTGAEMHPARADLDAFFALPLFRKLNLVDGLDVFARRVSKHDDSPQVPREITMDVAPVASSQICCGVRATRSTTRSHFGQRTTVPIPWA